MSHPSAAPAPPALAQASFPEEILVVLRTLKRAGFAAYLVGGSIRDRLLGKEAKDHDIATSARAEKVMKLFRRVVPTGIKHGTVTVMIGGHGIEVTTFRGEGQYRDGRRPESVYFIEDVVEDLARRDFTINAMAFDADAKTLVDPFEGVSDLGKKLVRCVGDAHKRFSEDGLRPLRAVRFASVLGFEIEAATLAAIPETLDTFTKVAQERVREELSRLLVGRAPSRGARLLAQTGLLPHILPEVSALQGVSTEGHDAFELTLARLDATPDELELRLAALLHDIELAAPKTGKKRGGPVTAALERLRFPAKTVDLAARLVAGRGFALAQYEGDASLRRALAKVGTDLWEPLFVLDRAQANALALPGAPERLDGLRARLEALLAQKPALTTNELALNGQQVMGILASPPGPKVGNAVRFLLDKVLEEPSLNTAEALEALLREWDRSQPG